MDHILLLTLITLWLICHLVGFAFTVRQYRRAKRRDVLWVHSDLQRTLDERAADRLCLTQAYERAGLPKPVIIHVSPRTSIKRDPAR